MGGGALAWLAWLGPPSQGRVAMARAAAGAHGGAAGSAPGSPLRSPLRIPLRGAREGAVPQHGTVAAAAQPGPVRPSLLTPAPDFPGRFLPRIAASGLTPRAAYAGAAAPTTLPRLGLVVAGIGLAAAPSAEAIAALPASVDLAVSAYASDPDETMRAARDRGHEVLQSLPMEPSNYPTDTAGPAALLTGASPQRNARNLEWVLSRGEGYAGVTGASDGQRGTGFAASPLLLGMVRQELAARGLFYLDPRPGAVPTGSAGDSAANIVIDPDREDAAAMSADLDRLRQLALRDGRAIGIVLRADPVALAVLARFVAGLAGGGLVLAPVSALVPANAQENAAP